MHVNSLTEPSIPVTLVIKIEETTPPLPSILSQISEKINKVFGQVDFRFHMDKTYRLGLLITGLFIANASIDHLNEAWEVGKAYNKDRDCQEFKNFRKRHPDDTATYLALVGVILGSLAVGIALFPQFKAARIG